MKKGIFILLTFASLLILLPSAYSYEAQTSYNCTDGNLVTNITMQLNGVLREIHWDNETCPYGCATNGLECNDPRNVDQASMTNAAIIFLIIGIVFLVLSYKIEPTNEAGVTIKRYYAIRYLYLAMFFLYVIMVTGILGGISLFGVNNFSNIMWTNYYLIIFAALFTFIVIFFSEVESWYKSMRKAIGDA